MASKIVGEDFPMRILVKAWCPTLGFLLLVCSLAVAQTPADDERKEGVAVFTLFTIPYSGRTLDAELGRLLVKENRSNPKSKLIELSFVRLKSTNPQPGPPTIYLDGGPGSSAISIASVPEYMAAFLKLREVGDVILLDQRGVGKSRPNLTRLAAKPLPDDFFASKASALAAFKERAKEAADYFRAQGVDLHAYNTVESANDVEDLRKALGAEKINLVGFSYGTHLGLAVIRQHGAHVNRAVLIGTEGQNFTRKLPSTSDASLKRLSELAAKDPTIGARVPDLFGMLKRVLERLEKEPVTVRVKNRAGKEVDLKVGKFGLQAIIMIDLGDASDLPIFPLLFYTLDQGDTSVLARFIEKRYNQFSPGVSMMSFVMDAASGATKERDAQIAREAGTALLGDTVNFPFPEITEAFGNPDLGDGFRSPIKTEVPTLFISGTLDNNTPPFQADEVRKSFTTSTHIIVENAGHEIMLVDLRVQQTLADYLRGQDVSKVKIALPPLKFVPLPEKK
jgi:pimeloyl-ACP methyl ester carboxylesterase